MINGDRSFFAGFDHFLNLDIISRGEFSMSKEADKPSQYYIDEKWDSAIDTMLRRLVYGSMAGGLAAVILFREYDDNAL